MADVTFKSILFALNFALIYVSGCWVKHQLHLKSKKRAEAKQSFRGPLPLRGAVRERECWSSPAGPAVIPAQHGQHCLMEEASINTLPCPPRPMHYLLSARVGQLADGWGDGGPR